MAAARAALLGLALLSATRTGGAAPCAPRAELGGDAEAIAKVASELKRLGVEASTTPLLRSAGCPVIVAAVELDDSGGIAVAVRDAAQRSEGRVVSDAAVAAAWIDSWLRDDFTVPASEPASVASPASVAAAAPPAEPPLLERLSLAGSFLQAWSDDGTRWSGAGASACVRVDGACIGGRFGYARQTVVANLTAAAKTDLSLLAIASYSHQLGRMSVAPEVGLGVGRLATSRVEGCKAEPVMCDPMDPTCANPPPACPSDPGAGTGGGILYVGDRFSTATYTPRLSAALRVAVPLFDHVWLDGLAAALVAPFGHGDEYAALSPDGTTMPNTGVFPLPGDPLLAVQLGVGLRVGAP